MNKKRKNLKTDIILIAGIVLAGAVVALIVLLTSAKGSYVEVRVKGDVKAVFQLNEEITYTIDGADGGHNTLVISSGKASVTDADCPDKLCVHMGNIDRRGQSIVCLPHQVVVEIKSGSAAEDTGTDIDIYVR